jgi:O-antigen/teichoic acid export membrane protein
VSVHGWDDQQTGNWRPYWEEDTLTFTHLPVVDGRMLPRGLPPVQRPPRPAGAAPSGNLVSRVLSELRNPMYRSGYVLVANTLVTNVIGVGFWAVAAYLYGPVGLGRATALVSALMLVATLSQLNLSSTLIRFLPQLGAGAAGRLIKGSYLTTILASLAGGAIFVVVLPRLSSQWRFVGDSSYLSVLFIVAVVAWEVFTLQDAALVGLQRPGAIPVENLAYGLMKLLLLVAGFELLHSTDILASWTAPLIILIPIINWLIFYRYLKERRQHDLVPDLRLRHFARFASVDYAGLLFSQATGNFMPLLVMSTLGPKANGSYYIAGIITSGAVTLGLNFSTGLTVEGSASSERLAELTRGVLRRCVLTMIPGTIVLILAAPLIGKLFGASDAASTATLLRLLSLSLFPCSIYGIAFSLHRIAGKPIRASLGQLVLAAMTLIGSLLLLKPFGVNGVALAGVAADVVVAIVGIPTVVAALRPKPTISSAWPAFQAAAAGRPAVVPTAPAVPPPAAPAVPPAAAAAPGVPVAPPVQPAGDGLPARSIRDARAERAARLGLTSSPASSTRPAAAPGPPDRPGGSFRRPGGPAGVRRPDAPDGPDGAVGGGNRPPGPRDAGDWPAAAGQPGRPADWPSDNGSSANGRGGRPRPAEAPDKRPVRRPRLPAFPEDEPSRPWLSGAPGGPPDDGDGPRGAADGPRGAADGDGSRSPASSQPDQGYGGRHRSGRAGHA